MVQIWDPVEGNTGGSARLGFFKVDRGSGCMLQLTWLAQSRCEEKACGMLQLLGMCEI